MVLFTVFTPTYQRASTLPRVVASLCAQTWRDFEWVVIDDGSTDGTRELVNSWANTVNFALRYEWQENHGKHIAYNRAAQMARGELMVCLDSDDELEPDALARFATHWHAIAAADRSRYSGVTCLCRLASGELVGKPFPINLMDSNGIELRYRYHLRGDRSGALRTEVLRQHPFPDIDGVTYIPESLVWDEIDEAYTTRCINEALYIVHTEQRNQLTNRSARKAQAPGLWRLHTHNLGLAPEWFRHDPASFFKSGANYSRFSLHLGRGLVRMWRDAPGPLARTLLLLGLPLGLMLWAQDHRLARREKRGN